MSKNSGGLIRQTFFMALVTVATTVGGAFVTHGDGSISKGMLFSAVTGAGTYVVYRKLIAAAVIVAITIGLYLFIAPHIAQLVP